MISSIALALSDKKTIKKYAEENGIKTVALNSDFMADSHLIYKLFDLIIWEPEFSKGKFPNILKEFFEKNKYTVLAVYRSNRNTIKIPEFIPESLIYFIETPFTKSSFKLFINKINDSIIQQLVLSTNLADNKNGGDFSISGEVDSIKQVNEFINFLAKTPNVICLVRCENGTEKNLVIQLIHQKGKTIKGPLNIINCALYPEEVLSGNLFGIEYNDDRMVQNKRGLLEETDSGTLVLENIECISEEIQYRLQAYLEHHTFRRIGSTQELKAGTRIIATTTHDLEKYVNFNSFSRELYFRFKAFEITIPPLRRRKSDILPLSNHFIQYYNKKFGHKVSGLTPEAEQMFIKYNWPGNVEELKLILKRAVLLTKDGHISLSVLPIDMGQHEITDFESEFLGNCSLRDIERLHIERVLLRTKGNKSKAAELLNISRTTLREKMRLFNLQQ
jgi:DNA-binding NtrC family response regulator